MRRKTDKRLVDELPDVDIPAPAHGQRELAVLERLFQPDMPDGELINLYFLVHDWHQTNTHVFNTWFRRVDTILIERMSGEPPKPDMDRSLPGYEPEQYVAATEAVCSGEMTDWQLLEMYAVAAAERADEEIGHRWQAIMDLCRAQILRRIKVTRARLTQPANDETSQHPGFTPSEREAFHAANEAWGHEIQSVRLRLAMYEGSLADALCLSEADVRKAEAGEPVIDLRMILAALRLAQAHYPADDDPDHLTSRTYVAHYYEAARRMAPKVREVWLQHHAAGLSIAEIAGLQGLSPSMVRQRLREGERDVQGFGPQPPKPPTWKRRGPKR